MPIYPPNIRFSDCWSSVGGITFYHRNGKCYWRSKPAPVFPGTLGQLDHQSVHLRALAAFAMGGVCRGGGGTPAAVPA